MANFTYKSLDDPRVKGSIDTLSELHQQLTAANHFPRRVLLVCNFCDERVHTGPAVRENDPLAQGEIDKKWAKAHRHTIQKWLTRRERKAA